MRNRYVDIEWLKDKFISLDWSVNKWVNDVDISLALSHEDLEPVKHGQWYDEPNYLGTCKTMFFCSRCGSASNREDPYCWHCGAKMDGGKDNADE